MSLGLLLDLQGKLLARRARQVGHCPERSANGYLCTLDVPHEKHEAWLDGVCLVWWEDPPGLMAETVVVIPGTGGYDSDGNPIPPGSPVELSTLGVAPGNTLVKLGIGGELDDVAFTVYLELGSPVKDDDTIQVRGKTCRARVSDWRSPWTSRGGMAVLARSVTGGRSA